MLIKHSLNFQAHTIGVANLGWKGVILIAKYIYRLKKKWNKAYFHEFMVSRNGRKVGVGGSFKVEVRFEVMEGVDECRGGCGLELVQK